MEEKKRNLVFSNNPLYIKSLPGFGWVERDVFMLHACFQIFMDSIEKDGLLESIDWNRDEEYSKIKKKIIILRDWWLERKDKDRLNEIDYSNPAQFEEDSTFLNNLILLRKYLSF